MSHDDVSQIVEIHDPEIDTDAIMRQIRENIRKRRMQVEAQGADYMAFAEGVYVSHGARRFGSDVYDALRRLSLSHDKLGVDLALTESQIPLVASFVQRVRAALHQLVIYYVNTLARQQARVNEYQMKGLTALVMDLESSPTPAEVEALRQEVAQLRTRLDQLEAQTRQDRA